MNKGFLLVCLCAMVVNQVCSQQTVVFLPQGFILESLSIYGQSKSVITTIDNISSGNPASIYRFQHVSFGISTQYETRLDTAWIAGIGHHRIANVQPQSLGLVIPIKYVRIGFGYSQKYNTALDFDEIEKTTLEYPEGTGETYIPKFRTYVTGKSFLFAYPFKNILRQGDITIIGGQFNWYDLNHYKEIFNINYKIHATSHSWTIGMRYGVKHLIFNEVNVGVLFVKGAEFKQQYTTDDTLTYDDVTINIRKVYTLVGNLPHKINMGMLLQLTSRLRVVGDLSKIYWNVISNNWRNQLEVSGSIIYELQKVISASVGFYSTNRKYDNLDLQDRVRALFITGGVVLRIRFLKIGISFADSHFFSGDWRKQTIGKLSFCLLL